MAGYPVPDDPWQQGGCHLAAGQLAGQFACQPQPQPQPQPGGDREALQAERVSPSWPSASQKETEDAVRADRVSAAAAAADGNFLR